MFFVDQRENLPGATWGPVQWGRLMELGVVPCSTPDGCSVRGRSHMGPFRI